MVRKAKDGVVRRGPSGQTVNPFVGSLYGGPRRRTTISEGLSRSLLGVPVEETLIVGVLEGVPIVLVNRLITGVFCRSENV